MDVVCFGSARTEGRLGRPAIRMMTIVGLLRCTAEYLGKQRRRSLYVVTGTFGPNLEQRFIGPSHSCGSCYAIPAASAVGSCPTIGAISYSGSEIGPSFHMYIYLGNSMQSLNL